MLRRLGSFLLRTLIFTAAFWIVAEGRIETPILAAVVVLAATATSLVLLPMGAFRVQALGLLRFVPWFLRESVQGGVDVAGRACRPTLPLEPGFQEYRLRLPTPAARTVFTNSVSLLPGTLSVSLRDDRLRIHALDVGQPLQDRLRQLEERVGDLLGIRLPATESAGRREESPVP